MEEERKEEEGKEGEEERSVSLVCEIDCRLVGRWVIIRFEKAHNQSDVEFS